MKLLICCLAVFFFFQTGTTAMAGTEGTISGTVTDKDGIALAATVKLLSNDGKLLKQITSSATGEFQFFPVSFGDYKVQVEAPKLSSALEAVHVSSGGTAELNIQLEPQVVGKEMVMNVKAKKRLQSGAAVSSTELNQKEISQLPEGSEISLPKLITSTTPGAIQGPFGQVFFRGNHANIQYQIDGIQLPDSPSNTFGQAFSPRNIDHMEVITGGIPAEYGERLSAVVNIATKSGPETPGGEAEINYGTYNTISPHVLFGGSNESGSVHYFFSANYNRTDRGLDTPEPASETDQKNGGSDVVHDKASGNNEFAKVDWLASNEDKVSFVFFNSENRYEIPNYPTSFHVTDAYFQKGFADQFGNGGDSTATTYTYVPSNTNDYQKEANSYVQAIWRHTFSERSFLQLAPYYKYSSIHFQNDPVNDLYTSAGGAAPIANNGNPPASFYEDRHVNNIGLKGDYSLRPNDTNLVKTGFQLQASRSVGEISVQTDLAAAPVFDSSPDNGYFESAYLQDDYSITKELTLNAGVRFDATQFIFAGQSPSDSALQPRIGLSYLVTPTTKLHAFYGRLFQPSPVENLRDTFNAVNSTSLLPYDVKAEKDNYWETGVAQQVSDTHVALVNVYYKNAENMLDDAQLLNTSIAQPYNFTHGYAYGAEFSLKGDFAKDWSDFANYSYEIAKGKGVSGGIFAVSPGDISNNYQYLDHVQVHTANGGVTYSKNHFWWTTEGLFGSGLRTGSANSLSLPSHFTADTTVGYEFHGDTWYSRFKLSGDVLNLWNKRYPITVANGFNGSHYAAGREFFARLSKEF